MPELPEVETVRRELGPWLTGRVIRRARLAEADPAPKYAALERADGQRIVAVHRRGKFLVLPLHTGDELIIHLGMTGVISWRAPQSHVRVILDLSGRGRRRLYFKDPRRFGRFLVVPGGDYQTLPTLRQMGPEPLGAAFTTDHFHLALGASRAPIKSLLLSQRPVAGLGNIYVDEALWAARIHPLTPARQLSRRKTAELHAQIVRILQASIDASGTTFHDYRTVGGGQGGFLQRLAVYGRDGERCQRCASRLRKSVVSQRGTHFCPRCQRQPARQPAKTRGTGSRD